MLTLENLFYLLSKGQESIPRKIISDIIYQFDLPLKLEEFFYFIGKKDTIYFEDFCVILKSSKLSQISGKTEELFQILDDQSD